MSDDNFCSGKKPLSSVKKCKLKKFFNCDVIIRSPTALTGVLSQQYWQRDRVDWSIFVVKMTVFEPLLVIIQAPVYLY